MTEQFHAIASSIRNTEFNSFNQEGFHNILCSIDEVDFDDEAGMHFFIQMDNFAVRTFAKNGYEAEKIVDEKLKEIRKDITQAFPNVYSIVSYLATNDFSVIELNELSLGSIISESSYLQEQIDSGTTTITTI